MIKAVINPAGANGGTLKTWQKAQALLKEKKADCEVYFSSQTESIADIVRKLTSSGEEVTLLLFGGDGTMNEAVNGIADFEKTKVGFVPCGSGNDLAKALGISRDLNTILDSVIENRTVRELDVGELTVHKSYDRDGKLISDEDFTRRFNISSGMGFDAEICAHVESSETKKILNAVHLGKLSYIAQALRVIFLAPRADAEITLDNEKTIRLEQLLFACAMNSRYEGGGFMFAPEADPCDGVLDIVAADHLSRFDFFRMFPYAYTGAHVKFKGVSVETCRQADIRTDIPLWLHTDGEVIGLSDDITLRISDLKMKMVV